MASVDLSLSGLASGFDWKAVVDQLVEVERAPEKRLLSDQDVLNSKNSAYSNIKTQLTTLQSRIAALNDPLLFDSRTAQSSDSLIASATAASGAAQGTYVINVSQLATASKFTGSSNVGAALSPTDDVSSLVLSNAGFPAEITAGTFTVNGKQITVSTSDTLQSVFTQISTATGGTVTAEYDHETDRIIFNSAGEIVLGSATDSSNFLQAARLSNSRVAGSISSSSPLGSVRTAATLATANLTTPINDGGSGAGIFKINGVEIGFNSTTDTVNSVISRINSSSAGVTASYDSVNDRFMFVSKSTGDIGIAAEDVTGNFLAATGLNAGTLTHGEDLKYTINGGDVLTSHSNTITEASSGIAGLSVTVMKENSPVTVTVGSDTAKVKTAIQNFIEAYNKAQSVIASQTASTTNAQGEVTAGVLAGDSGADDIATALRKAVYSTVTGLSGSLKHLADLGISTNGNDDTLTLEDGDLLDSALANKLADVKEMFSNSATGLAKQLDSYLTKTIGDDGTLVSHQTSLTKQASDIDKQILDMERIVQSNKERMISSFVAMETAQARISQQLQYLTKQFSS